MVGIGNREALQMNERKKPRAPCGVRINEHCRYFTCRKKTGKELPHRLIYKRNVS